MTEQDYPEQARLMVRSEWLKQMRHKAEQLYDHFSPLYWVTYGLSADELHLEYLNKLLARVPPHSILLSAACGAGLYDGLLLEAGHRVVGIDQSQGMVARARQRFPEARYEKMGLQEMAFQETFDGATCIDAMEHVCPEDWPVILNRFRESLKPGGVLYLTVDLGGDFVQESYERARAMGLPVVFGEVADKVEEIHELVQATEAPVIPDELADSAVYHYHPPLEQVRTWLRQAGLAIEEEGTGSAFEDWYGYHHLILSKR